MTTPALPTAATPRKHYHDIDGARSVLMFLSVALHAGTVYAPARPWITGNVDRAAFFDWLIFGIHLFVTPTFFFVGGFFAVLLLKRQSPASFLWNRFLRTVIPLVFIALSFNMVEHYLRWGDAGGQGSFLDWLASPAFVEVWASGKWQLHLWFLVSLIPMFVLSAAVQFALPQDSRLRSLAVTAADRFGGLIGGSATFAFGLVLLACVDTANYASFSLIPGAYDLIAPGFQSWHKLTAEFPFFVVGVMAALSPRLLAALVKWRWWMPYAAAAAFIFQPYPNAEQGFAEGLVMIFLNEITIWTLILFILQFFHRYFSEGGPRTTWLADCALSMYLFHHSLVYIYGQMLVDVRWPVWAEFPILVLLAAGTVIAMHELLVRRYAIVRLLANGKTDVAEIRRQPGLFAAFAAPRRDKVAGSTGLSPV
ncbi:acyltransferase family protein [Erythrobacter colymbi]|uniref:acyltransferase family protein n=1 Tax=Erythrobacter colymbi TaxID=1161202 RepID=UPI000A3B1BB6|nr:acyltransferase family protein [Erythrobacter colymbi]